MKVRTVAVAATAGAILWWAFFRKSEARPLTREELEHSATAKAQGLQNRIPDDFRKRAVGLAVLGGVAQAEGWKVISAFRSDAVNAAVGGVADSQHRLARALDIIGPTRSEFQAHPILNRFITDFYTKETQQGPKVHVGWSTSYLESLWSPEAEKAVFE